MDEELGGINPDSFFEQLTEVRETAQSAQKTSNSNLSLLNDLRSKVEIISNDLRLLKNEAKDKAFEEEDRKQKEKLENRAKSIAGESKGDGEDIEKEQEDPEKGLLGQIGDFISNLFGGIVGGIAGLAISGIGGLIDLGTRAASGAKRIGAGIADALTFNMFDFDKKGKPDKKNLSSIMGGDKDYEKNRKKNLDLKKEVKKELEDDLGVGDKEKAYKKNRKRGSGKDLKENIKEDVKEELKEELGLGDKLKETGKNILGGIKKTFGGIKNAISNFDGRPGSRETKDGNSTEVKPEESFSTSIKYNTKGNPETGEIEVDPDSLEPGVPLERAQQHFYKSKIRELEFEIRSDKMQFGDDANTSHMEKELEKFKKKYNETLEFGGYDLKDGKTDEKPNEKKKNKFLGLFNEGGLVQKFDEGGEVDSVPAMLTPGEFVVTKNAVQKVGVDTLKGLNASVGDTSKPELSSLSIDFEGGDMSLFEKKQTSVGGMDSAFMIDGEKKYLTPSQIKKQLTKMNVPYKELLNGMVIPDAAKMTADKMPEYYKKMKTVISETVPDEKTRERMVGELDKFMTNLAGGGDFRDTSQIEAEMNRYIPGTIENLGLQIGDEAKSEYNKSKKNQGFGNVTQNFNKGGLVTPINENVNPSNKTELELIDTISQSVTNNSQSINIINQQNAAMDKPNNQPAPLTPKTPPNISEAEVKDTTSPIPFVNLLRLNSQRYLNLGNDAMVIS